MPTRRKSLAVRPISSANLFALAILNLRRHGLRAAVNIAGISVAVAALVFFLSFYRGTYEGVMFSSVIDYATSQGQFMSASFDDDDPDLWLERENLLDEKLAQGGFLTGPTAADGRRQPILAPRLLCQAFAGDGSRKAAVMLAGVDFGKESEILSIDERMVEGAFGGDGVVIGKKLAATLSLSVGDEIRVQANTADGASNLEYWKVSGIYSSGYPPLDRGVVMMSLPQAQSFLGAEGKVNKLYSRLTGGNDSVAREREIASLGTAAEKERLARLGLVFKSWKNYAKPIVEDAEKDSEFYLIFIGILLFLSLSTMAGTMRVTVFERKREIGMLRATGWLQGEIMRLFLFEALVIGIAGSASGCLIGGAASWALALRPIAFGGSMGGLDIPSFALTCDPQAIDFLWSLLAGFLTALLAGLFPAASGARMPILSAMAER
jgi:ABC-type lipoprotein release transport system permease subunit